MADPSSFELAVLDSPAFQHRVMHLHDDVLVSVGRGRFEEFPPLAFEDAVLAACQSFDFTHDNWPNIADDTVWTECLLDRALTHLGLELADLLPAEVAA